MRPSKTYEIDEEERRLICVGLTKHANTMDTLGEQEWHSNRKSAVFYKERAARTRRLLERFQVADPNCTMKPDCAAPVVYIDNRGWVYCDRHGVQRSAGGCPTRRLTDDELRRLYDGETIPYYEPGP